jgi:hypothetical protein
MRRADSPSVYPSPLQMAQLPRPPHLEQLRGDHISHGAGVVQRGIVKPEDSLWRGGEGEEAKGVQDRGGIRSRLEGMLASCRSLLDSACTHQHPPRQHPTGRHPPPL